MDSPSRGTSLESRICTSVKSNVLQFSFDLFPFHNLQSLNPLVPRLREVMTHVKSCGEIPGQSISYEILKTFGLGWKTDIYIAWVIQGFLGAVRDHRTFLNQSRLTGNKIT